MIFQVNARWLLDLEEFNEWMNEEDYIVEEEVCSDYTVIDFCRHLHD